MASKALFPTLIAELVIWLVCAAISTQAKAEADKDTSFSYSFPAGWVRDVREDGRVNYSDPENPKLCYIQILPVIPKDISTVSEAWLLQFFDAELRKYMDIFAKGGMTTPHSNDPPVFKRIAQGTYAIYKRLTISLSTTDFDFQLMMLIKSGELQRLSSMIDLSSCPRGSRAAAEAFRYAATHIQDSP